MNRMEIPTSGKGLGGIWTTTPLSPTGIFGLQVPGPEDEIRLPLPGNNSIFKTHFPGVSFGIRRPE